MLRCLWSLAAACILITLPTPAFSQSRAFILMAQGGRLVGLTDLSDAGDELAAALSIGAGFGVEISPNVAIRGTVTYVRSDYRGTTLTLTDSSFQRLYYAADFQIGWPAVTGLAPYLAGGAGAVTVDPSDASADSFSKFAARFGTGVNYVARFGALFVEAASWVYQFNKLGFDRVQVDLVVQGGIALAIPF